MNRRKKRYPGSVCLFVFIVILICLAYEPVAKALRHDGTEVIGGADGSTDIRVALPGKERDTDRVVRHATRIEIPARLRHVPEQILERRTYTLSYNREWNMPNWVAWELNTERLVERESRSDKFVPDPDLPEDEAVTTEDYKSSGYDRGHMCPAADNRWHWRAMQESFYMSNICPQDHNLNRGDWKELEDACRRWAEEEGSIYIVCGPVVYRKGKKRFIGKEHAVRVPDAFFKVILCTASVPPRAIGFIFKNTSGSHPLDAYVNSVDDVERITGMDFFPSLPDDVEKAVEAKYDLKQWK